ncbi:carboxymuconolactone decarboxylase family protein [Streptomyces sp. NPDC001339]|uniref:carboxymuconolactone decarboxylase family protein n=1 Tax=Streptomyces sp. NPDC001339 TaxID=3364563 RepID=UPI003697FA00
MEQFLQGSGVPQHILELVRLRTGQINGCGTCVDLHSHRAHEAGESNERLWAWRPGARPRTSPNRNERRWH